MEGLSLGGETYENSESVRKACDFLIRWQRDDGGWGESYEVSNLALCFLMAQLKLGVCK